MGERLLFENLSLTLAPGEIWAVTGSSGAGKTSFLRCLSGELSSEGHIERNGTVAEIPQNLALNEEISAWENVVLARFLGRPTSFLSSLLPASKQWSERAVSLLKTLGIVDPGKKTGLLSGGEKQRVAAARALLSEWTILLADEPISQLDEANSRLVLNALRAAAMERGGAIVLVLHHKGLAEEFSSRQLKLGDFL